MGILEDTGIEIVDIEAGGVHFIFDCAEEESADVCAELTDYFEADDVQSEVTALLSGDDHTDEDIELVIPLLDRALESIGSDMSAVPYRVIRIADTYIICVQVFNGADVVDEDDEDDEADWA